MSTFAELTSIVKDNVLHVTPELSARIPGWIQQAQRRLEERFSWPVMRVRWAGDSVNVDGTTTGIGQTVGETRESRVQVAPNFAIISALFR